MSVFQISPYKLIIIKKQIKGLVGCYKQHTNGLVVAYEGYQSSLFFQVVWLLSVEHILATALTKNT